MAGRASTPPPQGDVNESGGLLATTILVTVISIVLVALRFATRIWIVKRVGWDDWTILFACLGHPIGMALVVVQISYGLGRPVYYLTDHQFQEYMKYSYGEWLQTFATLMFTKISICLFLLRITVSKAFIRPLQAAIVILILSNVILSLLWILQCTPHLDKAWNTKLPGHCFGKGQLERIIITQAIISFVSDYFLSIFPIIILRKVQISLRSKIGLCGLMGLGVVTGSLGVARTVLNWQNVTSDPTYLVIPNWYIRTWEVIFGIVAACVPTLRPGYKWLLGELHTQYTRRKSGGRTGSGQTPLKPDKGAVQWTPPRPSGPSFDREDTLGKDEKATDSVADDIRLPLQRFDSDNPPPPPPKPTHLPPQPIPIEQPSARVTPPHHKPPHIADMAQHKCTPSNPNKHPHPHWYFQGRSEQSGSEAQQEPRYPRDDSGHPRKEDQAMHVPGDLSTDTARGMPLKPKPKDEEAMVGAGCGEEELDYRI